MDEVKQEEIDFLVNWFENSSYEEIDEVLDEVCVINKESMR